MGGEKVALSLAVTGTRELQLPSKTNCFASNRGLEGPPLASTIRVPESWGVNEYQTPAASSSRLPRGKVPWGPATVGGAGNSKVAPTVLPLTLALSPSSSTGKTIGSKQRSFLSRGSNWTWKPPLVEPPASDTPTTKSPADRPGTSSEASPGASAPPHAEVESTPLQPSSTVPVASYSVRILPPSEPQVFSFTEPSAARVTV